MPEAGNIHEIKYSFLLEFPVTPFSSRGFPEAPETRGDGETEEQLDFLGIQWLSSRNKRWFFLLDFILDISFLKTQQNNQGGLHPQKTLNPDFPENPTGIWF